MTTIYPLQHAGRVYCAGPLFNPAERAEMEEISAVLELAGFETFVPHADGMEFAEVHPYLAAQGYDAAAIGQVLHEAVFALDVYQVVSGCGSLVLNLNGRVPDEGAVSEAAMAWMLGKPVVTYKADCRSLVAGRDNPLVAGLTGFECVPSISLLPEALQQRLDQLAPGVSREVDCPPHVAAAVEQGARLWQQLRGLGDSRPVATVGQIVLELFGLREGLKLEA